MIVPYIVPSDFHMLILTILYSVGAWGKAVTMPSTNP